MASVTYDHVWKKYGDVVAVQDLNLAIEDKEFLVLVGPSGCGKTTALRCLAGLEEITQGQVKIGDQVVNDVAPKDRDIAMVFQSYALYPHMSVYDNMAFGLKLRKMPKDEIDRRVKESAKILGIEGFLKRKPKELSGGQRQRVAVGRAIVREPKVFLFDEPLSNLDAKLRVQTRAELSKLHKNLQTTFIYVTHDQTEAMTMANRIAVMSKAKLQQLDTPQNLYDHPANLFVAGFIGSPKMNFMAGTLVEGRVDMARVRLPGGEVLEALVDASSLTPGQPVTLGIRPEHTQLGTATQGVVREVQWQERLGESTFLFLGHSVANEAMVIKAPGHAHADAGQRVAVSLPATAMHLFDEKGNALERRIPIADMQVPHAA